VYELLRVVHSALPVIGKILQHVRNSKKDQESSWHHQCAASQAVSVVRQQVGHAAHRSSLRRFSSRPGMAQNTNEEVMNGFYHLVENLYPDTEDQATITTQLTQFRSSHGIFGSPVAKTAASTMPAYQRWLNFGASVPELQEFAVRILSQTASSSEAERNWSLFGFVQNDRRCSLKSETLERMENSCQHEAHRQSN